MEQVQSPASLSWAVTPLSPQNQEKGLLSLHLSVTRTPPQCGPGQVGSLPPAWFNAVALSIKRICLCAAFLTAQCSPALPPREHGRAHEEDAVPQPQRP